MTDEHDGSPQDVADVLAVSRAWSRAIATNDVAGIADATTDDWVIVSDTGPSDRAHFLDVVARGRLRHSAMDLASEPRLVVRGDVALLTARFTNTAHVGDETFEADEWTTDVFLRRHGRWRCALSHITAAREP
jgi:ketosteroid isomerase-like protein